VTTVPDAIPQGHEGGFRRGHEANTIGVRGLVLFATALVGTCLLVLFLLGLWMKDFQRREDRAEALYPGRLDIDVDQFPQPRLQQNPESDLAQVQREGLGLINSYEWVDRQAGIARIPVERAMDILARTGLPKVPAPAPDPGAPPNTSIPPARKRDEAGPKLDQTSPAKSAETRPESKRGGKP
jgi:hypothetical protein